jgi:hypothetical protein
MKYLTLLFLLSTSVSATTFMKIPISQQIKESDGIIVGHFLRQKSVKLEDGSIATQMFFKMNKELGFQSDFFGMDEVIVHYPGGTLEGITSEVEGVPRFVPGEQIALFTKNVDNRSWGMNLGYGSFKVVNYGKDVMLLNTVFPEDSKVGQISLENFESSIRDIKGSNLKVVQAPETLSQEETLGRMPASVAEGKNRSLASKNEENENRGSDSGMDMKWLVICLAALGGIVRFMRPRRMP